MEEENPPFFIKRKTNVTYSQLSEIKSSSIILLDFTIGGDIMTQLNNSHNITINDLVVNQVYTNDVITEAFKCSPQGCMRRSLITNTLVLFVLHNNPLYDDKWIDGILHYTGMGQHGNQDIKFRQNKTLAYSNVNGVEVHLFESYKDKIYKYDGKVELAGEIYFDEEPDVDGILREVIKFPWKRLSNVPLIVELDEIDISNIQKENVLKDYDDKAVKELAKKLANDNPKKTNASTTIIERNPAISDHTKRRAKGKCDLCGNDAPFSKNGMPYLECHHVIHLADNGPDAIYNTVALCPNCHRRIHVLKRKRDFNKLINKIKSYLEEDSDSESLNKFKELFGEWYETCRSSMCNN